MRWDRICKPKNLGGLGLRKAEPVNKAMQMKLLWKIMKKSNNVWVRTVNSKYLKNTNVLNYQKKGNCSWQWSRLMELRETIHKGLCWQVGDGTSINFWWDIWVFDKSLQDLGFPNVDETDIKVSEYINPNGTWDTHRLTSALPINVVKDITSIHIPYNTISYTMF